jgi:flagellar biosynthesis GTPase FlhF
MIVKLWKREGLFMVQYLMEENIMIYIFAGLCGLGFLTRFILNLVYNRLVRETDNMGATKNKQLKHMKLKFETCYKLKIGVNNVDTFVDKNILKYRFCGFLLSTWENFGGQVLYLTLLLVPVSAVFGAFYDCEQDTILLTGAVGILASAILILVDKSINLSNKKVLIKLGLEDYFENFCKVRLEQEAFHPEELEKYRREYFEAIEASQQVSATAVKSEPKEELDRRREARLRKEEEKRLQALKRAEEQKRLEEARLEEEKRRMEERKRLAAKRREEELKKLEEERLALEARKAEAKRKAEERQQQKLLRQQKNDDNMKKLLHNLNDDLFGTDDKGDLDLLIDPIEEIAPDQEHIEPVQAPKISESKKKVKKVSAQEQKLVEDILKEFFA